MGGHNTAGGNPKDLPEAEFFGNGGAFGLNGFGQTHGVNKSHDLPGQVLLLHILPQELGSNLVHLATVFLGGLQLAVQQLDQGIQRQDIGNQISRVAHTATGSQVGQIAGEEAHPGLCADFLGFGSGLFQRGIGIGLQPAGHQQNHQCLTGGNHLGVHQSNAAAALGGVGGTLVGAGGDGRVGKVQNGLAGVLALKPVIDRFEIADGGTAGFGQLAGGFVIAVHILNGEGAVVFGLVAEGHMHGDQLNAVAGGHFGGDIGAGLSQQNDIAHKDYLTYAFDQSRVDATMANLNNMQVFSQVQFSFTPRDTTDTCSILDVRLDATMDKLIDAEMEFNVTQKSNSQVGPHLVLGFSKRNAFNHGETFAVKLKGSYEWQTQRSMGKSSTIDSYEYGVETSLTYPWLAFPGLKDRNFRYPTSSQVKISANHLNRANYYRLLSFGGEAGYQSQTARYETHIFTPLTLTYNKLQSTSARFDSISATNSALLISLRDQFIPAMQYTYRYDNTVNPRLRNTRWLEATIKESGNLISGAMALAGRDFNAEGKTLFGSPYSQFLKATHELRNGYRLSQKSSLATRIQAGLIWTYGNSSIAPYSELFYVGGANSIRAFGVRSIGPGSYYDRDGRGTYLDQAGDIKFEANLEYRFNLVSDLHGALFLDAGNVWLLRSDDAHPGGKFELGNFFDQLALGTGFGLRYDLQFLVLRLDLGICIHAPYDTGKSGYYNIPKFWDGLGFHFAIGYPF